MNRFTHTLLRRWRVPRPFVTSILWLIPPLFLWLCALPLVRHRNDAIDLLAIVAACAITGFMFGLCFVVITRGGRSAATWPQRLLVGALLGAALALLAGVSIHAVVTGWGGPGGGSFHRPETIAVALTFSWLIPLVAAFGVATPASTLLPAAAPAGSNVQ